MVLALAWVGGGYGGGGGFFIAGCEVVVEDAETDADVVESSVAEMFESSIAEVVVVVGGGGGSESLILTREVTGGGKKRVKEVMIGRGVCGSCVWSTFRVKMTCLNQSKHAGVYIHL